MRAETLRDLSYEVKIPNVGEFYGNRTTTLILDREGRWCDIPCASDTETLLRLTETYVKPRIQSELHRLRQLRALGFGAHPTETEIVIETGLIYYEPPETDVFDAADWQGALVEHMNAAGLKINPIASHLCPSLNPEKDDFLHQQADPLDYYQVSDLMTTTFVLAPAFSRFHPGLLNGECVAVGYNAAIGIDGSAILDLLNPEDITTFDDHPEYSSVSSKTVREAVAKLLE